MAATVQLRKCEELLGKVPEKLLPAARLARNPVFVFLYGLEGFDTERASECLVRLLDKHYDTIEVLKLATKRDLVEDAGILPGDALRIVAAAKEYAVPRDPNHEATSQCDHASKPVQGVEHRQDAYRPPALRETAVLFTPPGASQSSSHTNSLSVMQQQQKVVNQGTASQQEAVKEGKVVNQVEPKQAVKDGRAPTLPPSRGAFMDGKTGYAPADARFIAPDPTLLPPWRGLVDGKTGFVYYWNPVTNITQYDKPLSAVGSGPFLSSGPPPPVPPTSSATPAAKAAIPQTVPTPISYPHICRLCDAKCISEDHVRSHYNGQRHNTAVREAHKTSQSAKAVNPVVKAAEPQVVKGLKQPSQTQEDASGSKQPLQSVPFEESLHACGVCIVQCGSEIGLRSHFNGKKHAKKMELATESKDNRPTPYLYCSICDISSMSKKNLVMHFNGKRHAKNMKEDSNSGNSSYYSDSEIEF